MSSVWRYEKIHILNRRMVVLCIVFILIALILIGRIFYLQVLQGEKYRSLAEKNRISVRLTQPGRGSIFDRNGVRLAENKKTFQAVLIREEAPDYKKTLENFQKLLPLDETEMKRILKTVRYKRAFMPIRVKDNLTFEEMALLQLNAPDLKGIQIEEGMTRYYPLDVNTTHTVGYVSLLTERDLEDDPDSPLLELPGYRIGRTGLEKTQEETLKGTPGMRRTEINAYGRSVRVLEEMPPEKGENVTLTIDARLQEFMTKTLGNEAASAIVLDVKTGEILGLVSTPVFDPNLFTTPISVANWNKILKNERRPLQNKAVNGIYSPGSIFKLVVAIAGLESGHITADKKVFCSGRIKVGNQYFHCWKRYGHGKMDLVHALMHSCDIYFYQLAQDIGADKILDVAARLGFGKEVDIALTGGQKGLLPSKEWKEARTGEGWRLGDTMNLSIGQGFLNATPIQIVTAVAQIANGGHKITPHLIKVEGVQLIEKPQFNAYHLKLVKKGMDMVVNTVGGTAYNSHFNINGAEMAGKTASTQVRRITLKERQEGVKSQDELPWKYRDHAMFAAFTPIDKPRYAIVVAVEHGGGGARIAAPMASKILQEVLRLEAEGAFQKRGEE